LIDRIIDWLIEVNIGTNMKENMRLANQFLMILRIYFMCFFKGFSLNQPFCNKN